MATVYVMSFISFSFQIYLDTGYFQLALQAPILSITSQVDVTTYNKMPNSDHLIPDQTDGL